MAETAVLNDQAAFVEEGWGGRAAASTAAAWTWGVGGIPCGGVVGGSLACGVGIGVTLWGCWNGWREVGWGDVDGVVEEISN